MDKQMNPGSLNDLPLDIIHMILAFVPIREAVRTSLLSKQWRYIWTSLPYLDFDDECVNPPMENESDKKRLIHFISQFLRLHKGPIREFQLYLPFIAMSRVQFQSINQWLYSCQNLSYLKLHVDTIPPPPPSFKGFLFLRMLNIFTGKVDSSTIESIVAHSPLLEELILMSDLNSEMTIRGPNLKYLNFNSECDRLFLCTPLLEELEGNLLSIKDFSFPKSSVFHNLRIIELWNVPFHIIQMIIAVDRLIIGSPNLEMLRISALVSCKDCAQEIACVSLLDSESACNITYDSMKVIMITGSGGITNDMKLFKFLLARSPVLKRMIYKPDCFLSDQELQNLTVELLSYPRASASAEIVINK